MSSASPAGPSSTAASSFERLYERWLGRLPRSAQRYGLLAFLLLAVLGFRLHFLGAHAPRRAELTRVRGVEQTLVEEIADYDTALAEAEGKLARGRGDEARLEASIQGAEEGLAEAVESTPNAEGVHRVLADLLGAARDARLEPVEVARFEADEDTDPETLGRAGVMGWRTRFRGPLPGALALLEGLADAAVPADLRALRLERARRGGVEIELETGLLVGRGRFGTATPEPLRLPPDDRVAARPGLFDAPRSAGGSKTPRLRLDATLEGERGRVAVIGGEVFREGEQFGNARIHAIRTGEVVLVQGGHREVLSLAQGDEDPSEEAGR